MKKLLFFLLLLAICTPLAAQNVAKAHQFVEFTTDGVNLRKSPSASAPTLVNGCYPESDMCDVYWSDEVRGKGLDTTPIQGAKGQVMECLGESGDFFHLRFFTSDLDETPTDVYAAKRFLQSITPVPVTRQETEKALDCSTFQRKSMGGDTYTLLTRTLEDLSESQLEWGMFVDGICGAFPRLQGSLEHDPSVSRVEMKKANGFWTLKYGDDLCLSRTIENEWGGYVLETLDLSKLTDPELNKLLMNFASADGKLAYGRFYFFFPGGRYCAVCN